jgi:hypothetical protein
MYEQLPPDLKAAVDGLTLCPPFVNAHDHLEFNHYPRTKFRDRYANAHDWGQDVNARLDEPPYAQLRKLPLADRCFYGGLKNLLCGVFDVAHHNPPHDALFSRDFPVRVLKKYQWAHSLHFTPKDEIVKAYKHASKDSPFFIHLAEGVDGVAANEYLKLRAMGCIGENTVIIHGVGMTDEVMADAAPRIRGLVWCPTSNQYLFGKTINPRKWISFGGKLALGSDSRLTADGDFGDERSAAARIDPERYSAELQDDDARAMLGLPEPSPLDFIAEPSLSRGTIGLIVRGGVPMIGSTEYMERFPKVKTVAAMLDGVPKLVNAKLAEQIMKCGIKDKGLIFVEPPAQRKKWF